MASQNAGRGGGAAQALRFTRVLLRNWRNFRDAQVAVQRRAFVIGPNASGKSNLLDALRFLRDIARPDGGLASALAEPSRGGFKQVRCLFARAPSELVIEVDVGNDRQPALWTYRLVLQLRRIAGAGERVLVEAETVLHEGAVIVDARRADAQDDDWLVWTQTRLEQVQQNGQFRDLAEFFASIRYLHVVPQIVRDPRRLLPGGDDPFGGDLLLRMKGTPKKMREPRLRRISEALAVAVPNFGKLDLEDDAAGRPHLLAEFHNWRPHPTKHSEELFSDGTLRLIGFLWSITERGGPLLLEEPELSLHDQVVAQLPAMIARAQRLSGRQVIATTHSQMILDAPGVGLDEVLRVTPGKNGSTIAAVGSDPLVRDQVTKAGWPIGQAVLPLTAPPDINRLATANVVAD
jgi:predicted ATPase